MRIILIEDDQRVSSFLKTGLEQTGYAVDVFENGTVGLEHFETEPYDLAIVDRMLPGLDGLSVCKQIRKAGSSVPILFLTAQDSVQDKVDGLQAGADDYLTKPFSFLELAARIESLLRRKDRSIEKLAADDLVMDVSARSVKRGGETIELSNKEFSILEFFLRNKNRLISQAALTDHVWDLHFDRGTNVVYVYINYLRQKLNCGSKKKLIHTVRGAGYILKEPE